MTTETEDVTLQDVARAALGKLKAELDGNPSPLTPNEMEICKWAVEEWNRYSLQLMSIRRQQGITSEG